MNDFYVAEISRSNHRLSKFDGVRAALHTDHGPARAHTRREQTEGALWTTTDLDNPGAHPNAHLIEKPFGLMGKLLRLLHKPLLLGPAVTQEVLIIACHIASRICQPDPLCPKSSLPVDDTRSAQQRPCDVDPGRRSERPR